MLMLSLLMGCRSTSLGFVMLVPEGASVQQAYARVKRYRLRDCDDATTREWVGQRLDLLYASPDVIRDREWCGIDIEFKTDPLLGAPLGWRGETAAGTNFDVRLAPATATITHAFGGDGRDHVILLDPEVLLTAAAVDTAAYKTDPPLDEVDYLEDSAWSVEQAARLSDALVVLPLGKARQEARWPVGAFGPPRETSTGCAARRQDSAVWWGDTGAFGDTGYFIPADSGAADTGQPSTGGCSCDGPGADTASDTGDTEDTEDTEADDDASSGGCLGSSDTGDSDSDSGWSGIERRLGGVLLVGLFWLRRRRGGTAAPVPR